MEFIVVVIISNLQGYSLQINKYKQFLQQMVLYLRLLENTKFTKLFTAYTYGLTFIFRMYRL